MKIASFKEQNVEDGWDLENSRIWEEGEVRNHIPLPANYHKSVDKLRTPQDGIGNPFHPEFFAQPAF